MVAIAQLVERQIVVLDVAGSSPVSHPSAPPMGLFFLTNLMTFNCPSADDTRVWTRRLDDGIRFDGPSAQDITLVSVPLLSRCHYSRRIR